MMKYYPKVFSYKTESFLYPFVDIENTQRRFHFKLICDCMWHDLCIQCKMHTWFSTCKSRRRDESTKHLKAIFRSRNPMNYNLNEVSNLFFFARDKYVWHFCVKSKEKFIYRRKCCIICIYEKTDYAFLHRGWVSLALAMFYTICPLTPQF